MLRNKLQRFFTHYGPWAVIAGASEGLGAAYAHELAARGFNLVLIARNAQKLEHLAHELNSQSGIQVKCLSFDLAEESSPEKIITQTGELDIGLLVYNAAYAPSGPFLDIAEKAHQQALYTNCRAPMILAYRFASLMRKRKRSGIILMSSLGGFQGSPNLSHYAATKAYNIVLAEGLGEEFKELGVDVLVCCPGAVATPGLLLDSTGTRGKQFMIMAPEKVATIALKYLGAKSLIIPGFFNRLSSFAMRRLIPRHMAVLIMKKVSKGLLKGKS